MKDSFIFYRSFYEAIDALPEEKQLKLFKMICELGLNNLETTEQDKMVRALFTLIEPQIKANNRRYQNGKKGGAPKGNTNARKQPKNNQKTTKKQPNVNVNVNVNDNVNDNVNGNGNDNIYDFTQQQLGRTIYPAEIELLNTWEDNELTRYAIKETVLNNVNSLKYTQAILNSYKAKNITTVAQAQKESKKIKADVPSWLNEERKEKEMTDEQKRILERIRGNDSKS